ncbi:MAG TPA: DUF5335 family protein [Actinomycetota bacterium]|nr:DUF5335 family protein [Actinomycetota bacterium]
MSPPTRQPVRQEWPTHFATITEDTAGTPVTIEIISPEFGTKIEADEMPLDSMTFDERDDTFIIAVNSRDGQEDALRHIVEHPWKITFDPPAPMAVRTIDVEGPDGAHSLVTLHSRPALPEAD